MLVGYLTLKLGRNDPCHCGSGNKYKKCCLIKDDQNSKQKNPATDAAAELRAAMQGQQFHSIDEAQAFIQAFNESKNSKPIAEFYGLSASQMHKLQHQPFNASPTLNFNWQAITNFEHSPMPWLMKTLLMQMGKQKVKATATGALGANLVKSICEHFNAIFEPHNIGRFPFQKVHKEMDFQDLYLARFLLNQMGYMRKFKGYFILTKKGESAYHGFMDEASNMNREFFQDAIYSYCIKLDWNSMDEHEPNTIIQMSWAFCLFMLTKKDASPWHIDDLAEDFVQAFPALINESDYVDRAMIVQSISYCLQHRLVENFGRHFGLLDISYSQKIPMRPKLRRSNLCKKLIQFSV